MPTQLAGILKAAGEPTRLRILNVLRQGSICVCDLQAILRISQPTISRHLAALRHAGLVQDVRSGPRVIYSLARQGDPQVQTFLEFLETACSQEVLLQPDLDRLRSALQQRLAGSESTT
jgi:ArsR family transcriptional regulator